MRPILSSTLLISLIACSTKHNEQTQLLEIDKEDETESKDEVLVINEADLNLRLDISPQETNPDAGEGAKAKKEEGKVGNAASAASCHGTRSIERASVATRSIDSQAKKLTLNEVH